MGTLSLPFLELSILLPLFGMVWVARCKDPQTARLWCVWFSAAALGCSIAGWLDFVALDQAQAVDAWDHLGKLVGSDFLMIDELSAPLLSLAALLHFLTILVTLRTKARRFSFVGALASEVRVLMALSCREPWVIIALLAVGTLPPYFELRARRKPTRVYVIHMTLFVVLMVVGWAFVEAEGHQRLHSLWSVIPLLGAIFVRSGIVPFHCWMTDLFEHATFGTALLFVTPMMGAYAAVRLVLPIAPDWVLHSIGIVSLFTAVYTAGMALVQRETRRFFCYVFLSHSALVLTGLETANPIGLTGGLCVWLSVGIALGGFGITLRALEARFGRQSLVDYWGLYDQTPSLALCFLLTGMASVGFPGTFGFIGTELLVDGAVQTYPYIGAAVVVAAALNGIAVVRAYFVLFTGRRHVSAVTLTSRGRERFAVLTLATLILLGGLFPQPGVASRFHAALHLLRERDASLPATLPSESHSTATVARSAIR